MFDTLKLGQPVDNKEELQSKFPPYKTLLKRDGSGEIQSTHSKIENLELILTAEDYLFIEGSLPKFYFGNNFQTLDISTTQKAVESVSAVVGFDISEADIYKLHIAGNISVDEDCRYYYHMLDYLGHHDKMERHNGVYFTNHNRSLAFYDKIKENKGFLENIPKDLLAGNLLRYEARIHKNLKTRLNHEKPKVKDLYNIEFYNKAIKYWYEQYLNIQKMKPIISLKQPMTSKEFQNALISNSVQNFGGIHKMMNLIKTQNKLSKEPTHLFRSKREKLISLSKERREDDYSGIRELDTKINLMYQAQLIN
jgi:hypothetical protein